MTDARQKLLDYGQPALSDIRSHSTPRVAEAFHLFLLTLYDSLAQAAELPAASATANPRAALIAIEAAALRVRDRATG